MKIESFNKDLNFNTDRIVTSTLLETSFSKEIRILIKQGQVMKEHRTPYPIVVHVLKGKIDFGVERVVHPIREGGIIALDGNIPHDVTARQDSIIRLTLSKLDKAERVEKVVQDSSN